jgi:hypothetical protein
VAAIAESVALGARCLDDLAVTRADTAQETMRGFAKARTKVSNNRAAEDPRAAYRPDRAPRAMKVHRCQPWAKNRVYSGEENERVLPTPFGGAPASLTPGATVTLFCGGRRVMRRFVVAGTLLGVLVLTTGTTAAWADEPLHEMSSGSGVNTSSAGEVCDFGYSQSYTFAANDIIFGDPDDPDRVITQFEIQVTHTNLDTGFALTEDDHFAITFDAADAQVKVAGNLWHLRDVDGKIVLVSSGLLITNDETGERVKVTPAINPDFAAVICPLLGGQPAS